MRLALLTALFLLLAVSPASATEVTLSVQGHGTVLGPDDQPIGCATSFDENKVVDCATFQTGPLGTRLSAVAPDAPEGHWTFDRWDGSGCVSPTISGEPANVCVIPGTLASADPVAVFEDKQGPTIESVTEHRPDGTTVRFDFTTDEDAAYGAEFSCSLVGQTATDCSSGTVTYSDLAPGSYEFSVQGVDASGQPGATVSKAFTIDAPPIPESPKPPVVLPAPTFPAIPRVLGPNAVTAKVSRKRTFSLGKVRLVCPAVAVPCKAKATIKGRLKKRGKQVRLVSKPLTLRPSSSTAVKLKLGRKVAKALRKRGRLKGVASLEIRAPDVTTRKDVAVTLRAPKKR